MDLHEQGMSSRTFVIAAIVCVLLQAGLAPQISIAGGRVNFMIILVCLSVFSGDPTRCRRVRFCSGLFYDLSAAVPVGVMSLLLTVGSLPWCTAPPVRRAVPRVRAASRWAPSRSSLM